ncbi:MAG: hypothetical protein IJ373_01080, partial [Clostridia bacterium]|nr:hypothetical protein [Clostridia bacterium]
MKKKTGIFNCKRVFAILLTVWTSVLFTACRKDSGADVFSDVVYRENYDSVYAAIGEKVTLDFVREGADGRAYVTVDGREYELGMDFLSMAMVYNARPTALFSTAA